MVFVEYPLEMQWLRETKRAQRFAVPMGTQDRGCSCGLLQCVHADSTEDGKHSSSHGGRFQEGPSSDVETAHESTDAIHVVDVAEHFTETTHGDGKHESRDYVFANTATLRAVRRFQVSKEQVFSKHTLLVVEIDLAI